MIYGDNPNKINEREDALGLKAYTYVPNLSAIVQSGNLYVYCGNSPLVYVDSNGNFRVAFRLLFDAFFSDRKYINYSSHDYFIDALNNSDIFNKEIKDNFEEFIKMDVSSYTFKDSISFYGNDANLYDLDLHLGIGLADYIMTFNKKTVKTKDRWLEKTETIYIVEITIKDYYNFDDYREGKSISNQLNNWGYEKQIQGKIEPYYWRINYTMELKL